MDGFLLVDLHGNILETNDSYCQMVGYTRDQLLDMHISALDAIENVEDVARRSEERIRKGSLRFETKHRHVNGSIIDVEISSNYASLNGGSFLSFIRDISHQKQIEKTNRKSEELYRNIVETQTDFVDRYLPGGILTYVNPALARFAGVEAESLLGASFYPFIHEDDRKETIKRIESITRDNSTIETESRIVLPDGRVCWNRWTHTGFFDERGAIVEYQSVGKDISERRDAEDALRESEEKYRNLYENADIGIFRSTLNDRFIDVNPALARMLGYDTPEEAVNSITSISKQVYSIPEKRDAVASNALENGGILCVENIYCRKDGTPWQGLLHLRTVFDQKGKPSYYEGFIDDITERKKIEKALQESEKRYRLFINMASEGVLVAQGATLKFVNPFILELIGYSEEELLSLPFIEFVHPDDRELMKNNYIKRIKGEEVDQRYEIQIVKKDATIRWVEISGARIEWESQPATLNFVTDITVRKQAEQSLIESEERFKNVLQDVSSIAVQGYAPDGITQYWNKATEKLYGYSAQEAIGQNLLDLIIPPEMQKDVKQAIRYMAESGQPIPASELSLMRKDGSLVTVFSSHVVVKLPGRDQELFCLDIDLTEQKRVELALRKSEEKFSKIFKASPEVVVITDIENGKYIEVNDTFLEITGLQLEEVIGHTSVELNFWIDVNERRRFMELLLENGAIKNHEVQYRIKNNQIRNFLVSSEIIEIEGKQCSLNILNDITGLKKAEEEKLELERQLQEAHKLESLGVLAGGIAHDFNNLLAVIIGRCSLAMMKPKFAEDHIPPIEKAANRAAELCRQMLAYAGKSEYVQNEVNIEELVDEMVNMLRATIAQNVVIKLGLSSNIPSIKADPSQIRQVVMNLIINASEAIGEAQGEILISLTKSSLKAEKADKDHLGKIIPSGNYVCLEVIDSGCGMDEDTKRRIFEPFYTTKFTGRGLGMSAVLGIITAHKGALQIFSKTGLGTTFKVYLPVLTIKSGDNLPQQQNSSESWRGSGTILLAEDEEQVILIAKTMLEELGFTVIEAYNGKEALELYEKKAAEITLVMTDIGMPVMDGYALFSELKTLNPKLPIIISSGYGDEVVTSRINIDGVAGLVSKPYRFDQLRDVMKRVVEETK